jgi:aminoglycoside phosphotransferase (APT) family kinase protein
MSAHRDIARQSPDRQASLDKLIQELSTPLSHFLGKPVGDQQISLLSQNTAVTDGTTVLAMTNNAGHVKFVILCSPASAQDSVKRAMERARKAKELLSANDSAHILSPLFEGNVAGASFAVLPFCKSLSESPWIWWPQRILLRNAILDWLACLAETTTRNLAPGTSDQAFMAQLQRMASLNTLNDAVRQAAEIAAKRLESGQWAPRHGLMHGDLWKGNILLKPADNVVDVGRWPNRFAVIDWGGAENNGYPIYDLVRFAISFRLSAGRLRKEVSRHCRILECEISDAMPYLLAALGFIANNLGQFPLARFTNMAESCFNTLRGTSQ